MKLHEVTTGLLLVLSIIMLVSAKIPHIIKSKFLYTTQLLLDKLIEAGVFTGPEYNAAFPD